MSNASPIKVFKASAGSGKTYRLTYHYILLLFQSGYLKPHKRILAVTFTNKATAEMKSRILRELFMLSGGGEHGYRDMLKSDLPELTDEVITARAKRYLTELLSDYSGFRVQTIDGFFQQVVRAFSREIGLQGGYQVDLDTETALEQGVDRLLAQLDKKEHKRLLNWLTEYAEERIENGQSWNTRKDIIDLGREIFKETYATHSDALNEQLNDEAFLKHYRSELRQCITTFEEAVERITTQANQLIANNGLVYADFSRGEKGFISHFNIDVLKGKKYALTQTFKDAALEVTKWYSKTSPKKGEIEGAFNQGLGRLACELLALTDADNELFLNYGTAKELQKKLYALGILSDIVEQINLDSRQDNKMLLSNTTEFLKRIISESETPFIYEKTGVTIDHYMIDEFQDTSKMQWNNFIPLLEQSVSQGYDNLLVGDVKQSIYRWRNSDWHILHEEVDKVFKQQVEVNQLDTNYRSDHRIIEFNNTQFEAMINTLSADFPGKEEEVKEVYSALKQQPKQEDHKGMIEVCFFEDSKDNDWQADALEQLNKQVKELLEQGYQYKDMAVLTRTGAEATQIATFLLQQGYDVLSNEALVIQSAPSVQLLLAAMRYLKRPSDSYNRALFALLYYRLMHDKLEGQELHSIIEHKEIDFNAWELALFGEDKAKELQQIRHFPLFKMSESLIVWLDLQKQVSDIPFIQAFQDRVHHYGNEVSSDINLFLNYWEEKGSKQFIAAPEGQNAIRIMTIHKSKGLEFDVVFVPFCDWSFSPNMPSLFWAEPKKAPFNQLPVAPITYGESLMNTWFRDDYLGEKLNYYLDTLNVAYVAFTRACKALYITAPIKASEKKLTLSNLLFHNLSKSQEWQAESNKYRIGQIEPRDAEALPERLTQDEYISDTISTVEKRLKLRFKNQDHWEITSESPLESQRLFGNLMHDLLEKIATKADVEQALHDTLSEGVITEEETHVLREMLTKFFEIPETNDWFSNHYRILREAEIITPQGMTYRPDRVMLQGKRVVIVDYKFGTHEDDAYHRQVQNYMRLVRQMGYEPEGYLCYATLNKVVEVH